MEKQIFGVAILLGALALTPTPEIAETSGGDTMTDLKTDLKYLYIPPRQASTEKSPVLVVMHGVGSNEKDLASWAESLDPRLAIYSLRGPLDLGPGSHAWFHVKFTAEGPIHNKQEAESSRQMLKNFLKTLRQSPDVDASKIFLLGFSQGTIMGLSLVFTEPSLVTGLVALGGRTLQEISAQSKSRTYERPPKVLLLHGLHDNKLPVTHALTTEATLKGAKFDFNFKTYDAGHEITEAMKADIQKWLSPQI